MFYKRRYIQFNDLVFDNYSMVSEPEHQVDFKVNTQEYGFGNGSYLPLKRNYMFAKEQAVSLTLTFGMLKLPCEFRPFYKQFAVAEIGKPGKLWAVVNNELVWAHAVVNSFSEGEARKDEYVINVDFVLPEGVWHKADRNKTFLTPYDPCTYLECKGFQPPKECGGGDCCEQCRKDIADAMANEEDCGCCCCGKPTKDMALCNHYKDLQDFYEECTNSWLIKYSCRLGEEYFGDNYTGSRICTENTCTNVIAGLFYSDTEMPTTGVELIIDGEVSDPAITINDNTNVITGTYEKLRIKANGDVYSITDCCETLLNPSVWNIPSDSEYGWTIHQGQNSIVIDRGSCCGGACAYVQVDSLTV